MEKFSNNHESISDKKEAVLNYLKGLVPEISLLIEMGDDSEPMKLKRDLVDPYTTNEQIAELFQKIYPEIEMRFLGKGITGMQIYGTDDGPTLELTF